MTLRVDAVPLSQITDSTLRCSLIGRILGYGTIRLETTGQKQALERLFPRRGLPSHAALSATQGALRCPERQ